MPPDIPIRAPGLLVGEESDGLVVHQRASGGGLRHRRRGRLGVVAGPAPDRCAR